METVSSSCIDWAGSPPFGRRVTIEHTLEILRARRAEPLIVELGTSQAYSPDGLGNALLAFAWFADKFGGSVLSMDVWQGVVDNSRQILAEYAPGLVKQPTIACADCFDWASGRMEPIDLLYMDASMEIACDASYSAFAARFGDRIPSFYLELYRRFRPEVFKPGALMLFDDTDMTTYHGKGKFAIPFLLENGWRRVDVRSVPVFPMVLLEKA